MRTFHGLLLAAVLAAIALPDEIRLKNGSTFEGRIVKEDGASVTIDLGTGRMTFARKDVAQITRTPVKEEKQAESAPAPNEPTAGPAGARKTSAPAEPRVQPARPPAVRTPRAQPAQPRGRRVDPEPPVEKETGRTASPSSAPPPPPVEREAPPQSDAPRQSRRHPASRPTAKPDW